MSRPVPNFAALVQYLEIDEELAQEIRALINGYRDFFTETMARPPQDGGPSPVLRFVEISNAGAEPPLLAMVSYAQTALEPRSGRPYMEVAGMHEYGVRERIKQMLPAHAREALEDFGAFSLLDVDTGYDPFQRELEATLREVATGAYAAPALSETDAQRYKEYFCPAPFEFATIDHDGHVFMCCPAWLPKTAGNLAEDSWEDVWNSKAAQNIRASILDASFKYCNEANCPHLRGQNGRLVRKADVTDPYLREVIEKEMVVLERGPQDVTIQYDPTCNLTCPSCRCDMYKATKDQAELTRKTHERVWTELVGSARRLTIAGNGDPFASKLYREALRAFDPEKYPNLKIAMITNGLLLTPEMWQSISNAWPAIESIHVSFNAATPETFRINQRGGEMDKLLENLGPLSDARRRGEFPLLSLGFYVLENNFHEMKDIIDIGKKYKVDRVLFGHFMPPPYMVGDDVAYHALAVHLPEHPLHGEFLEVLNDPVFLDPIVAMTNLTPLMPGHLPHGAAPVSPRDRMSVSEMCAFLQLSVEQAAEAKHLVSKFARNFSNLMFIRPVSGADAPGHVLAALLEGPTADIGPGQLAAFEDYAREQIEPAAGAPYASIARDMERQLRRELLTRLDPAQRALLAALPLLSLLDLDEARSQFLTRVRATAQRSAATH